jgi:apolipoprotein N-acyltransferase
VPLFYPVISGILYALSFPPTDFHFLAWISLVPLLVAIRNETPRGAFWKGWLAGGVAFLGLLYWVTISMARYGKLPWPATIPILLLLVAYMGLYLAGFSALLVWIRSALSVPVILLAPVIWTTLEWVRGHALSGFPWVLLGYSQYQDLPIIQIADLTGVYGVSFLMVLVNAAITEGLTAARRREVYLPAALTVLAVAFVLVYGYFRLSQLDRSAGKPETRSLRVGVVQGNIPQDVKWDLRFRQTTLNRYEQLTHRVVQDGVDLVVWPEAAMPFIFEEDLFFKQQILRMIERERTPLLFGSPARASMTAASDERATPFLTNSAFLLDASGNIASRYDKIHLVPFGEYVPLSSVLFFVDKMVEGIGDFAVGTEYTVMPLPSQEPPSLASNLQPPTPKLSVVICFEVIFPELVRRFVKDGAQFMVTITNDAWFGRSSAPYQHFSMAVFRSVENRVPFVRAANTGISGFIEPSGRIRQATDLFVEAAITDTIRLSGRRTFYSRAGDLFAGICGIIMLALIAFRIRVAQFNTSRRTRHVG